MGSFVCQHRVEIQAMTICERAVARPGRVCLSGKGYGKNILNYFIKCFLIQSIHSMSTRNTVWKMFQI